MSTFRTDNNSPCPTQQGEHITPHFPHLSGPTKTAEVESFSDGSHRHKPDLEIGPSKKRDPSRGSYTKPTSSSTAKDIVDCTAKTLLDATGAVLSSLSGLIREKDKLPGEKPAPAPLFGYLACSKATKREARTFHGNSLCQEGRRRQECLGVSASLAPAMSIGNTNNHRLRGRGRSTGGGPTIHERSSNVYHRIEYPPAPRMLTIPLPPVHDTPAAAALRSGSIQAFQNNPLIREEGRVLSVDLEHRDIPYAVVSPVVSDMPGYAGHMWGAANEYVGGARSGRRVHFVDSMAAATNPPQIRLRIMTPWRETLIVDPRAGNTYVAVGDVQRAVIGWMRHIEQNQGQGAGFTQRSVVQARDGTRMEVDIWMWRGLLQVRGRIDLWVIQL
ncbi:hypothetical protein P691DRAFT_791990 [Macrolepiota fuliginosa MF-IS2]|uniref:Uncharacterized protein n=1 Tax=Macrolepiota fuliginosa MF-IS2 TaxID=1400762 RepID=A0A9P5XES0_9AGAR|nr:hypothetical protein P691DRAFT_791990 [Macrolepiota fuliginosa MF-IS2]